MTIKILSDDTINKIAAGEVIERPTSVVKELVENSIDAGADYIKICFDAGGRNFISIRDNGTGMDEHDLRKSIIRHATSKLDENDINNILHFGFRGEALASISAVSRVRISSKFYANNEGWKLETSGGDNIEILPDSINNGTLIEVRDLFYSIPVRLKFLKSERSENSEVTELVTKIALANLQVGFSLSINGKNILEIKKADSLLKRISDLFGSDYTDNLSPIMGGDETCKIHGYAGMPTFNKGISDNIYIFINKRPVKDKLILSAIKSAYQDFLAPNRFPVVFLLLELDAHEVDVNVHPTKSEVRFRDTHRVRSLVYKALLEAIIKTGDKTSSTISKDFIDKIAQSPHKMIQPTRQQVMESLKMVAVLQEKEESTPANFFRSESVEMIFPTFPTENKVEEKQELLIEEKLLEEFPLGNAKCQLMDTYVVAETSDGIVLVDQHAAHERLVYEGLKSKILSNDLHAQQLAFPIHINIKNDIAELFVFYQENLNKLGLTFELSQEVLKVKTIPSFLSSANVEELIQTLIENFRTYGYDMVFADLINHILATYSCHHSIRSGRKLNINEMNSLLRQMESTLFSGQCNHGRPTYIKLSLKDIEILFGRR